MNKRLKYLLAIFVLAICILLYLNTKERGNLGVDKRVFSVKEERGVDKVTISDFEGKGIELVSKEGSWLVSNNSVQEKRKNELVKVITGLKVRNRASAAITDSLLNVFEEKGSTVKYFNENRELLSYSVLFNPSNPNEVIVLGGESQTPFYAYVFGEDINFSEVFTVDESSWNTLLVLDLTGVKLKKVCIDLLRDDQGEFCILAKDSMLSCEKSGGVVDSCDVRKGIEYLRSFKMIKGKKMYSNSKVIRSLIGDKQAFYKLRIRAENELTLLAYRKTAAPNQVNFAGESIEYDNEYFYLLFNNNLYLMDYFSFEPLMKTDKDFYND